MLEVRIVLPFEFGNDPLGEQLTKLNSPLIERIDIPNRPLRENGVFIKGNKPAKRGRSEPLGEDGVGRAISFKYAMRDQPFRRAFSVDFIGCLSKSQRFGLGNDVRHQDIMMAADGIESLSEGNEVAGNQAGSLMDQLIK